DRVVRVGPGMLHRLARQSADDVQVVGAVIEAQLPLTHCWQLMSSTHPVAKSPEHVPGERTASWHSAWAVPVVQGTVAGAFGACVSSDVHGVASAPKVALLKWMTNWVVNRLRQSPVTDAPVIFGFVAPTLVPV